MYLSDYHVHPNYSMDAEPWSIERYCDRALDLGLKEICFTTHFECDPVRKDLDWRVRVNGQLVPMDQWGWIDHYFGEIETARQQYNRVGLTVKAGVEVGYDLGLEPVIEKLTRTYPWDFVMGSIHCLEHMAISSSRESAGYFPGRCWQQVCKEYYKVLREAVSSGLFDCIGHLDIYKRHGCQYLGQVQEIEAEFARDVLQLVARKEMGLEVNTSGLRRGDQCLPSGELVKLAKECGIRIFTVGSDAHRLSELGLGIDVALRLLEEHNLSCYGFFQRIPTELPKI